MLAEALESLWSEYPYANLSCEDPEKRLPAACNAQHALLNAISSKTFVQRHHTFPR